MIPRSMCEMDKELSRFLLGACPARFSYTERVAGYDSLRSSDLEIFPTASFRRGFCREIFASRDLSRDVSVERCSSRDLHRGICVGGFASRYLRREICVERFASGDSRREICDERFTSRHVVAWKRVDASFSITIVQHCLYVAF